MRHLRKYRFDSKAQDLVFPDLLGFDEDEEESSESEEESGEEGSESGEEESDEEEGEEEGSEEGREDTSGLKSALDKERKARKAYEKELKDLRKFKEEQESASKSEKEKAEDRAEKAEKALEEAQVALRDTQLNFSISEIARKMRFRDIDDALSFVDRSEVEFDEDGNYDKKELEKLVKAVADKKPHLLLSEGEGAPSGSKFGGKKRTDQKAKESSLKEKYPALGR